MNIDGPTGRGKPRGAGRHDTLMLLAAVAVWGVITGSITMRSGTSAWAGPDSAGQSIAQDPSLTRSTPDTLPTAEAHLGLVREAMAER